MFLALGRTRQLRGPNREPAADGHRCVAAVSHRAGLSHYFTAQEQRSPTTRPFVPTA